MEIEFCQTNTLCTTKINCKNIRICTNRMQTSTIWEMIEKGYVGLFTWFLRASAVVLIFCQKWRKTYPHNWSKTSLWLVMVLSTTFLCQNYTCSLISNNKLMKKICCWNYQTKLTIRRSCMWFGHFVNKTLSYKKLETTYSTLSSYIHTFFDVLLHTDLNCHLLMWSIEPAQNFPKNFFAPRARRSWMTKGHKCKTLLRDMRSLFSKTTTLAPSSWHSMAVRSPQGPPPMTST